MIYRELSHEVSANIMAYCEAHGIQYDIWNAEEAWFDPDSIVELGFPIGKRFQNKFKLYQVSYLTGV